MNHVVSISLVSSRKYYFYRIPIGDPSETYMFNQRPLGDRHVDRRPTCLIGHQYASSETIGD